MVVPFKALEQYFPTFLCLLACLSAYESSGHQTISLARFLFVVIKIPLPPPRYTALQTHSVMGRASLRMDSGVWLTASFLQAERVLQIAKYCTTDTSLLGLGVSKKEKKSFCWRDRACCKMFGIRIQTGPSGEL